MDEVLVNPFDECQLTYYQCEKSSTTGRNFLKKRKCNDTQYFLDDKCQDNVPSEPGNLVAVFSSIVSIINQGAASLMVAAKSS